MFSNHFTFSKRGLGWLLVGGAVLGILGVLAVDILDVGREGGIGPAQQIALALSVVVGLIGLTLIPLGKDPA
jgi:hypothetical protein